MVLTTGIDSQPVFTLGALARCPRTSFAGTNLNVYTPFLQLLTPEFGHTAHARAQGLDLILWH